MDDAVRTCGRHVDDSRDVGDIQEGNIEEASEEVRDRGAA